MKRWEFNQSVLSLLVLLVVGFAQGRTQELKQRALRAFVSLGGSLIHGGLAGGSRVDQLPQRLSFDGGVLGDELCECAGVVNKGIPPSFEVVKKVASRGRLAIDVGELRFNGRGVDLAHQFADKLHLSPSPLAAFDGGMGFEVSGPREIDASPDVGFELGEAQADFLQSLGFALQRRFGGFFVHNVIFKEAKHWSL